MNKWYAVPGYGKGPDATPHKVVNAKGELIATVERLEDAESIAANHTPPRLRELARQQLEALNGIA